MYLLHSDVKGGIILKPNEGIKKAAETVKNGAVKVAGKANEISEDVKAEVIKRLDANGNGEIDVEDIIILALKAPGVRIYREQFLRKELAKYCSDAVISKAVATSPKEAGIDLKLIDHICDEVIKKERFSVSGISAVLGIPGGIAMAATLAADMVQYYGVMIRTAQELLYLYGFPEIYTEDGNGELDSETLNILTLCIGVMFGVSAANKGINAAAKMLAQGVPKQLMKKALTKGTIYPLVKQVAKWFGVKMTKDIFTKGIGKAIPVAGAVVGGGLSFVSFGPACKKLKQSLHNTALSNPDIDKFSGDDDIVKYSDDDIIDITDFSEDDPTIE